MPDLTVVSERSTEEIKKERAALALKFALVNITANLIRIVRGAGKPERLFDDIDGLAGIYNEYCGAFNRAPDGWLIRELLRFTPDEHHPNDDRLEELLIENTICREALQVVASSLADQRIHKERARNELRRHLRQFVDLREAAKKRKTRVRRAMKKVTR